MTNGGQIDKWQANQQHNRPIEETVTRQGETTRQRGDNAEEQGENDKKEKGENDEEEGENNEEEQEPVDGSALVFSYF